MTDAKNTDSIDGWRLKLHEIIFEADTPLGRTFDILLIVSIFLSVVAVMLDSVGAMHEKYGAFLYVVEWAFTILFSVEYLLRLICVKKPWLYAGSFFGIIDLLAVIPTYLSLFFAGGQYLITIRVIRVLRIFRVLKLAKYLAEADLLLTAVKASSRKIAVFLFSVLTIVIIAGSLMYLIEGEEHGFTSIPKSVYWAIVTMTTVGYGDVSPQTPLGQMFSCIIMVMGYGIIAVPTGIVTVELSAAYRKKVTNFACISCGGEGHDDDAEFCKFCGGHLEKD